MHKVMIQPASHEDCQEAIDQVFHHFPIDVKGKQVLVKPNVLRASEAQQGIVTHPAVVSAVVEKLKQLDAGKIIVGDNPGIMDYGANEKAFKQAGLYEAAAGCYQNIGVESVEVDFLPGFYDKLSLSKVIMESDIIISLPKLKTHGLTVVSGAIKNSYGFIPGAPKSDLHAKSGNAIRFNEIIVDVFALRVPDLFIVDAIVGMEGNGPASTELRDVGLIMASDNGVALDATITRLMGTSPEMVPFLDFAQRRGLGEFKEEAIEIIGELNPIKDYKLPLQMDRKAGTEQTWLDLFHSRTNMRPVVTDDSCDACETCVDQCPVTALSMVDELPQVDSESCIACFCCQELCPQTAISLG